MHTCNIPVYAVNVHILAWKLCMFFTHYELSFIHIIIISNKKESTFGGLGQLSYVCVWHDPAKLNTLCMQFPVRIWMKNKTTVISSRLIRERVELVNNQSVYLV